MAFVPRFLTEYLHRDAACYPVLAVAGPTQSGKTTMVKAAFPDYEYVSLEETDVRRFAAEDPRGFLARHPVRVILDEVQRAPDLLSSIQTAVDSEPVSGRFILTGRCGVFHLLPFSRAELDASPQPEPRGPAELFGNATTRLELWIAVRPWFAV